MAASSVNESLDMLWCVVVEMLYEKQRRETTMEIVYYNLGAHSYLSQKPTPVGSLSLSLLFQSMRPICCCSG